jgi:hypothetical protein
MLRKGRKIGFILDNVFLNKNVSSKSTTSMLGSQDVENWMSGNRHLLSPHPFTTCRWHGRETESFHHGEPISLKWAPGKFAPFEWRMNVPTGPPIQIQSFELSYHLHSVCEWKQRSTHFGFTLWAVQPRSETAAYLNSFLRFISTSSTAKPLWFRYNLT